MLPHTGAQKSPPQHRKCPRQVSIHNLTSTLTLWTLQNVQTPCTSSWHGLHNAPPFSSLLFLMALISVLFGHFSSPYISSFFISQGLPPPSLPLTPGTYESVSPEQGTFLTSRKCPLCVHLFCRLLHSDMPPTPALSHTWMLHGASPSIPLFLTF